MMPNLLKLKDSDFHFHVSVLQDEEFRTELTDFPPNALAWKTTAERVLKELEPRLERLAPTPHFAPPKVSRAATTLGTGDARAAHQRG